MTEEAARLEAQRAVDAADRGKIAARGRRVGVQKTVDAADKDNPPTGVQEIRPSGED